MPLKKIQETRRTLKPAEKEALRIRYQGLRPSYERMTTCLQEAMKELLLANNIPSVDVVSRVKDIDSAFGKIELKKYLNPFDEVEDWCGLRIICYYPSDIDRVSAVLQEEFAVQEKEDTSLRLKPHEFGYRSTHFILKIKDSWLHAPAYRGLGALKAEVQVRTLLMHAWAEIEHKLAYKSTDQVPPQFKRKLYRLSAKFEEADEQFEDLRIGLNEYRASLRAAPDLLAFHHEDLNLDTLQEFLDKVFPNRRRSLDQTADLLQEISTVGLSMADIVDAYERTKPILDELERADYEGDEGLEEQWVQVGAMRVVLDAANESYYKFRVEDVGVHQEWVNQSSNSRLTLAKYEKSKRAK